MGDLAVVPGLPEMLAIDPDVMLAEARVAAIALTKVIESKARKVILNGEQYLEFEDWQTVGRFYGLAPRILTERTRWIEVFEGVRGWEAAAEVVHVETGRVVSSADAMCLTDEPHWRSRPKYEWRQQGNRRVKIQVGEEPVPLFQLRSMAQTRAAAKALRNALAWVVVLAGFRPTPAEEMDHGIGEGVGKGEGNLPTALSPVDEWVFALRNAQTLDILKARWEKLTSKGEGYETFTAEERGRLQAVKDERKDALSV